MFGLRSSLLGFGLWCRLMGCLVWGQETEPIVREAVLVAQRQAGAVETMLGFDHHRAKPLREDISHVGVEDARVRCNLPLCRGVPGRVGLGWVGGWVGVRVRCVV